MSDNEPKMASIKEVSDVLRAPGESLTNFGKEWKALTEDDKVALREGIGNGTMNY